MLDLALTLVENLEQARRWRYRNPPEGNKTRNPEEQSQYERIRNLAHIGDRLHRLSVAQRVLIEDTSQSIHSRYGSLPVECHRKRRPT